MQSIASTAMPMMANGIAQLRAKDFSPLRVFIICFIIPSWFKFVFIIFIYWIPDTITRE